MTGEVKTKQSKKSDIVPAFKEFTDFGERIKQITTMLSVIKDRPIVLWKLTWSSRSGKK